MHTIAKKHRIVLRRGTKIHGRWHNRTYRVLRELGSGTVGTVYLCQHQGNYVALKLSEQSFSMMKEVEALRTLKQGKVQDSGLGPYLIDVDDWQLAQGKTLSFYVMEYIQGVTLKQFVRRKGPQGLRLVLFQLLDQLERLHRLGYVFGDLKSENIIVMTNPSRVRLIDVGGMTKIGSSVKEYTNFYDRAYWRLGKRVAEPSYDLFALTMVMLSIFYPKKFTRVDENFTFLRRRILQVKSLHIFAPVLIQTLAGTYKNVPHMRKELHRRLAYETQQKQSIKVSGKEIVLLMSSAGMFYCIVYLLTILF
ncbi:MAG TPA: protein kinase [Pseudogracilibacillus sp.]|nr:protein kinase [Pseudogracilibacillus sp.]